jgi:hypothetical protein
MDPAAADFPPNVDGQQTTGATASLRVTIGELRWVVFVALIILAVSCLPYVVGYLATPPNRVFGGFLLDEIDSNTYLAKMQQGARGQWTALLLHTPEDHPALVLYLFYLALGHLAAWLGLPLILVYHVARIVCGLILLVSLYLFLSLFLEEGRTRWVAYLLAAVGSGLGWLIAAIAGNLALGGISPIDFWLMEAYVFFTLFLFPQSALAMGLLLGVLGGMTLYFAVGGGWRPWLFALGCGLALALLNPYVLVVAAIVLAGYWLAVWIARRLLPWREALALGGLGLLLAPPMAYYALQFNSHPVWRSFLAQDVVPSPPVWYYLAGYGLIFLLALPGAWYVLRLRDERQLLLVAWPVMVLLAVYVPLSGQRRMIFGAVIPFSALAAIGLVGVIVPWVRRSHPADWLAARGYSRERLERMLIVLTIALASISNLFLVASSTLSATLGHPDVTQPLAVEEAIVWLGERSAPDDVILSSYRVGNIIPARIGRRVVWGQWDETAFFEEKKADVAAFFDTTTADSERQAILRRYGVDYVFYGPSERDLGDFDPASAPYLKTTFSVNEVAIYQVAVGLNDQPNRAPWLCEFCYLGRIGISLSFMI